MTLRDDIVAQALTYKGVPFVHQGRSREGLDCAGLLIVCARDLGLANVNVTDYRRVPDGKRLLAICRQYLTEIDPAAARQGDVLAFLAGNKPRHLGIIGNYAFGGRSLVHAYYEAGRVVETRLDDSWRVAAAFSFPGVA